VDDNEWTGVVYGSWKIKGAFGRYEKLHNLQVQCLAQGLEGWDEIFAQRIAWEYPQIYSRFAQLPESGKRIDGIVARIPSGGACTW
jgi:hypothetical protein